MSSAKNSLLVIGYLREIGEYIIPDLITEIIKLFNTKYIIYGIGLNEYGQLSLGHTNKIRKEFIRLKDLESLLPNIENIFINSNSIFIKTALNEIFVCGDNTNLRLGNGYFYFDTDDLFVSKFAKITNTLHEEVKYISTGICNTNHTFQKSGRVTGDNITIRNASVHCP